MRLIKVNERHHFLWWHIHIGMPGALSQVMALQQLNIEFFLSRWVDGELTEDEIRMNT